MSIYHKKGNSKTQLVDTRKSNKLKKSDCDVMEEKFMNTINSLGNCVDTLVDEKKTKMNVLGSLFKFGFSLTKLTVNIAGCAIKNTPKAVVAVAAVKREIVSDLESEWNQYKKEQKEEALSQKIQQLSLKR